MDVSSKNNRRRLSFPLLIKLLDAEEKLSLQVHPPARVAARLGGEPKTEMWYIADARPGSELYVGLRRGVTRAEFERKINDGTVADCFHRLPVKPGGETQLAPGQFCLKPAGVEPLTLRFQPPVHFLQIKPGVLSR